MDPSESPRRLVLAVLVWVAMAAAAVPVVAALATWAFPATGRRFVARVVCGKEGRPSHACALRQLPRAEFVDRREAKTRYQRCVTLPTGARYCDSLVTPVVADTPLADPLDIDHLGAWRVTWTVGGRAVGDWGFTVNG